MEEIKIEYQYNGKLYRLNGDLFDVGYVLQRAKDFQKKYSRFAERINNEGGMCIFHLIHPNNDLARIRIEYEIVNVSNELTDVLNKTFPNVAR